jgi:hypothetical protein
MQKHGVKLIHISTDYVFDGNSALPLSEASLLILSILMELLKELVK